MQQDQRHGDMAVSHMMRSLKLIRARTQNQVQRGKQIKTQETYDPRNANDEEQENKRIAFAREEEGHSPAKANKKKAKPTVPMAK
jgi:hypothetical protein